MNSYKRILLILTATLTSFVIFVPYAVGQQSYNADLLQYVNPLQGSGSTAKIHHGGGALLVGVPHGAQFWSPRGAGFGGGGYRGGIAFTPLVGNLDKNHPEGNSRDLIAAKPNYIKARYDNGVTTEMTATERSGYFKVSYPGRQQAYLVINGDTSNISIDAEQHTLTRNEEGNYVIIQFDQPFVSHGTMKSKSGDEGSSMYVEFKKGAHVGMKVSTSDISLQQAKTTFDREIGSHSFKEVKEAAGQAWNKVLGKIVVEGGTLEQKKTFYSCLFRANLRPSKAYEVDKEGNPHFYFKGKVHDGYHYSNPILWDAFRSLFPLHNLLNPEIEKEYMQSLVKSKLLNGWWKWRPGGPIMLGNHAIPVFADAWAKGIHTFDPDSVLKYYYHEVTHSKLDADNGYNVQHVRGYGRMGYADYFAKGYIPYPQNTNRVTESTSRTLEYAYDDFAAYRLAKMTGNTFYANIFKRTMYNYKNVFDTTDHFMKGRDAQGHWDKDFDPYEWGGPFVEGNAWQWKWFVPQDTQGLINLMGGRDKFASELDELFEVPADSALPGGYGSMIHEINESAAANMGQYGGANEPGFNIIYLYDYAGQPWKAQQLIRTNMDKLFGSGPKGFLGDEDGGAVSSWYVFSALGFYPVTPGTNQYAIGSPVFDKATITLDNGKKFIIEADNNSKSNVYIQQATLNGESYPHNWITYEDIIDGGTLRFEMGASPNKHRGTQKEDLPYSLSKEE